MDKTLQTLVGGTDTNFFAAVTVVSDVGTMGFFTQTMVPIPETLVFAKQTILLITETIFPVAKTTVSDLNTTIFVSDPMVPASDTMGSIPKAMANASKTMVFYRGQIIETNKLPASVDFYHGLRRVDHGICRAY
jgi:hypothetical protein